MDGISHGLWSYLIWYDSPYTWLAVAAGVLPDVIGFIPAAIVSGIKNRSWSELFHFRNPPKWAKKYKDIAYPLSHSLIVSLGVWVVVSLLFTPQWWLLAWPLHVIFDVLSHPKENSAPFLYPLSDHRIHGAKWWEKEFLAANILGLAILAFFVLR